MHLLIVQIQWMTFIRIVMVTIQSEIKILIVFGDMVAEIMANKKLQVIIKELFIRCKKLNISLVFITQSYFCVAKDVRLMHKITVCFFWQLILVTSKRSSKTEKNFVWFLIKLTVTDNKMYDLDRKAAKISALSSNYLNKYEYLSGEDLGLKPGTVEQAKFEYSPLGIDFTKGLDKNHQKEGLLKRLKNIEDKNEELLKANEDQKAKYLNKTNSEKNKAKNLLIYNSKHSFYKYRLSEFIKLSSTDSKFNKIEECYDDFIALKDVDAEPENIKHKLVVLN